LACREKKLSSCRKKYCCEGSPPTRSGTAVRGGAPGARTSPSVAAGDPLLGGAGAGGAGAGGAIVGATVPGATVVGATAVVGGAVADSGPAAHARADVNVTQTARPNTTRNARPTGRLMRLRTVTAAGAECQRALAIRDVETNSRHRRKQWRLLHRRVAPDRVLGG
jgi:hypothetical protein